MSQQGDSRPTQEDDWWRQLYGDEPASGSTSGPASATPGGPDAGRPEEGGGDTPGSLDAHFRSALSAMSPPPPPRAETLKLRRPTPPPQPPSWPRPTRPAPPPQRREEPPRPREGAEPMRPDDVAERAPAGAEPAPPAAEPEAPGIRAEAGPESGNDVPSPPEPDWPFWARPPGPPRARPEPSRDEPGPPRDEPGPPRDEPGPEPGPEPEPPRDRPEPEPPLWDPWAATPTFGEPPVPPAGRPGGGRRAAADGTAAEDPRVTEGEAPVEEPPAPRPPHAQAASPRPWDALVSPRPRMPAPPDTPTAPPSAEDWGAPAPPAGTATAPHSSEPSAQGPSEPSARGPVGEVPWAGTGAGTGAEPAEPPTAGSDPRWPLSALSLDPAPPSLEPPAAPASPPPAAPASPPPAPPQPPASPPPPPQPPVAPPPAPPRPPSSEAEAPSVSGHEPDDARVGPSAEPPAAAAERPSAPPRPPSAERPSAGAPSVTGTGAGAVPPGHETTFGEGDVTWAPELPPGWVAAEGAGVVAEEVGEPEVVGDGPPTYGAEPTAWPEADPEALDALVPDTVLDGARYGRLTLRTAAIRGDSARYRGRSRGDALLTARFGTGDDALLLVAMASGPRGADDAHRAARDAVRWIAGAVGRSRARLAEDLRAARRGELKAGLHRLTDRCYGRLRARGEDLGLDEGTYTASLRCLLLPADPGCDIRLFFGVGDGGLFRLRDGAWQDLDVAPDEASAPFRFRAAAARPGDALVMCGAGLAEPLRGEPELADRLAARWSGGVPGLAAYLADVQTRVKGYADDRTVVTVWDT